MPLDPGDLLFVGWDSDNDDIAFVATTDIAAGEVIYFTDNEWDGSTFNSNEQLLEWTVPAGGIAAGTVVTIDMDPSGTVTFDSGGAVDNITGGNSNNIAGQDEMFWAFQGTRVGDDVTPSNFVAVIGNEANGANDNQTPNLTGTGLTTSNGAIIIDGDEDYMEWTADSTLPDPVGRDDLIASILDTANWSTADGGGNSNPNPGGVGFDVNVPNVVCFAAGTRVATLDGEKRVEQLRIGQEVKADGRDSLPIRWIGRRYVGPAEIISCPKLCPIRITAGSLGRGLPQRDLLVSRQHRMLISSKVVQRMFGITDVLVPAIALTAMPGIYVDRTVKEVTYYHILCDDHVLLLAEGAPAESLYLGSETLKAMSEDGLAEVCQLFPEVVDGHSGPKTKHTLTSGRRQKRLIARHKTNKKPLLELLDL